MPTPTCLLSDTRPDGIVVLFILLLTAWLAIAAFGLALCRAAASGDELSDASRQLADRVVRKRCGAVEILNGCDGRQDRRLLAVRASGEAPSSSLAEQGARTSPLSSRP